MSTVRVALERLLVGGAAVVACGIVTAERTDLTPIDSALPFLALLVSLLGWLAGRFEPVVDATLPLFVAAAIAVPGEPQRLLTYGVLFACAATLTFAAILKDENIDRWRPVGFIVIVSSALRAIPASIEMLIPTALILVGIAVLTLVVIGDERGGHAYPLLIAVAAVTPLAPTRAALFPLVLAGVIHFTRNGSLVSLLGSLLLAIVAGKWALLLVLVSSVPTIAAEWIASKRSMARNHLALPALAPAWPVAVRLVAFAPGAPLDALTAKRGSGISALILAAIAIALRPALALMYLLAAAMLVVSPASSELRRSLAVPSAAFAAVWLVFLAWSGALPPTFPLPAPLLVILGLSLLTTSSLLIRPAWLAGIAAAFLFIAIAALHRPVETESQVVERALGPGESAVVQPQKSVHSLTLIVSGSNVSALRRGSVGSLEFVDRAGRGYRRDLEIGEVADWGAFRPAHFFATQNPMPEGVATIVGYGSSAFPALSRISVALEEPVTTIRITAAPTLPPNARLELRRLELPR